MRLGISQISIPVPDGLGLGLDQETGLAEVIQGAGVVGYDQQPQVQQY